ncbi:MAG: HAD family phosphatase [Provencibacterium sp.]|jgi:beta-phosphoglucomutase|nr:HAD family phosphatase [Provencibacterium sp.]
MSNRFKMAVFDLDGVILDSEPLHARSIIELLESYGVSDFHPEENIGMSSERMWAWLIEKHGIPSTPEEMVEQMTDRDEQQMRAFGMGGTRHLNELLDRLEENGVLLGIASSSERRFVDAALRQAQVKERFPYTLAGSEAPRKKPAPDLYLGVLKKAGVRPEEAAAIEDSSTGLRAAKQAGLFCIGYRNPTSGEQDLSEADAVVEDLLDAAAYLLEQR